MKPYIESIERAQPAESSMIHALFAPKRPPIPEPPPKAASEDLEARAREKLRDLEAIRARYFDSIGTLIGHVEERPYDPGEIVDLAAAVAERIVGRAIALDRTLLLEAVEEAVGMLGGERPERLRVAPADRKLLAEERPDLLARAMEIVEDGRLAPGGCIVEGTRRGIDASVEGRLERFTRALKGRLGEGRHGA
jgi:hypothetical protein